MRYSSQTVLWLLVQFFAPHPNAQIRFLKAQIDILRRRLPGGRIVPSPSEKAELLRLGGLIKSYYHAVAQTAPESESAGETLGIAASRRRRIRVHFGYLSDRVSVHIGEPRWQTAYESGLMVDEPFIGRHSGLTRLFSIASLWAVAPRVDGTFRRVSD